MLNLRQIPNEEATRRAHERTWQHSSSRYGPGCISSFIGNVGEEPLESMVEEQSILTS